MEERQGCIDSFARAYADWFPQLHNIGRVNTLVDGAFRRASGALGIENVVGRDSNMWVDGRPTSPSFEPFLNCDRIAHGGWYAPMGDEHPHLWHTSPDFL